MTSITLLKRGDKLAGFHVEGHSGYGTEGGDIVCASISSAVMLSINGIMEVAGCQGHFAVEDENALIELVLDANDTENVLCAGFLKAFDMHMQMLCEEFSDYMKLNYKEVHTND